jgi:N-methylhydantoinase A/oxoprolinase/acetone carboxylase beta subunit
VLQDLLKKLQIRRCIYENEFLISVCMMLCFGSTIQSDGGLAPVDSFYGFRAILSGPAGGVVVRTITRCNFHDFDQQIFWSV